MKLILALGSIIAIFLANPRPVSAQLYNNMFQYFRHRFPQFSFGSGDISEIVSKLLLFLYPLAGLALFVYLVLGGLTLLTSSGSPEQVEKGKKIITTSVIGFVIVFTAYWITWRIGAILRLSDAFLLFDLDL